MTTTTASSAGSVEYSGAPATRTMSDEERRMLEAQRVTLVAQVEGYLQLLSANPQDREYLIRMKHGTLIMLAATEDKLGVEHYFKPREKRVLTRPVS